eukprot:CAMPEP_0194319354 /NCGR_PEP_ID=MMETSP0171-20130528/15816_1 /TAXON_ID=218684 /ORGANISM="Corethron pennatum, Strain L29A3" /LENGTH=61 /DNA_ID=CAMNT_0039076541 /DNA_START=141 /DNA_END=325 /DNA_ORIENTATION=+
MKELIPAATSHRRLNPPQVRPYALDKSLAGLAVADDENAAWGYHMEAEGRHGATTNGRRKR